MHDLRTLYAEIEIKVSEPFIAINETVGEASAVRCFADTPNKKNQISMTTEPMDKGLLDRIQQGQLFKPENQSILTDLL
jgi:U5 small nuclear ribonucleoprotein component